MTSDGDLRNNYSFSWAKTPPLQLRQHWRFVHIADQWTLQQQKPRRFSHQSIFQMCPEHRSDEPQQHHTPFSNLKQQHHIFEAIRDSTGHKQTTGRYYLQHSQHLAVWKFHWL